MAQPSWLHEKTVAMIAEACRGGYRQGREWTGVREGETRVRLQPGSDELSDDLMEGVKRVKVTDEWDSVGGIRPDLILYDVDDKPKRIVEVIVTSPPDDKKRRQLNTLKSRGVDVVEVTVKSKTDLLDLFPPLNPPSFPIDWPSHINRFRLEYQEQRQASNFLDELTVSLIKATPSARRRLFHVLGLADGVDALYPTPSVESKGTGEA